MNKNVAQVLSAVNDSVCTYLKHKSKSVHPSNDSKVNKGLDIRLFVSKISAKVRSNFRRTQIPRILGANCAFTFIKAEWYVP